MIFAICLVHEKPENVRAIVQAIQTHFDKIILHVDLASTQQQFEEVLKRFPNVEFALERELCTWGSWGIVQATLNCIKQLQRSGEWQNCEHVQLLSGSCFPVVSAKHYRTFLSTTKSDFITAQALPVPELSHSGLRRTTWHYDFLNNTRWFRKSIIRRRLFYNRLVAPRLLTHAHPILEYPPINRITESENLVQFIMSIFRFRIKTGLDFQVYYGSQWWCLRRQTCDLILEKTPKYAEKFKTSLIPDETFFQTLVMNEDKSSVINFSLTLADWSFQDKPHNWSGADRHKLEALLNSEEFMFLRKFDSTTELTLRDWFIQRE